MDLPPHASGERDYIAMRTLTVVRQYLAAAFLLMVGLIAYGCGDSATVNPEATLASLTVNTGAADATLDPVFNPATTSYTVNLSNNVTSVTITAQPAVAGDNVTIDGQATTSRAINLGQPVPAGSTTLVSITVSDPPNTPRTYTVLLRRAPLDGNNSLRSLTVSPGTPPIAFEKDTRNYTVSVLNNVDRVTVTPTLDDPAATMTVNGQLATSGQARTITPLNPPGQSSTIAILVRAQNGTEQPYTITVSRGISNNKNLQSLGISPGQLSQAFRADRTSYTVNLPATVASNVTNVRVTPTLQDTTASMTVNGQPATSGQAQTTPLPAPGFNSLINVVVTAQDRTQNTYTVNVIRDALGGNNNLENLAVSPGPLVPAFTLGNTTYSVEVGSGVRTITVTPTLDDPAATLTVTSNGPQPITTSGQARTIPLRDAGLSTTINIVVRAPNGSQKPYTITVDREAPPPPSGNNNLSALTVRLSTSSPNLISFSPNTTSYTVDVGSGVGTITVTPGLQAPIADPAATLAVTSNGPQPITTLGQARTIPLRAAGLSTTINIVVRALNGSEKPYTITVDRADPPPPSGNNNLQILTVSPGTLSPNFDIARTRTDYAVNDVSSSATTILVTATPQDSSATVTIDDVGGNPRSIPLPTGPSTTEIVIRVIAPNTTVKTYSITVDQPAPAAPPAPPTIAPDLVEADDSCSPGVPDPAVCAPGTSREDNVTNDMTPGFSISPPGTGVTPKLYVDGVKDDNSTFTQGILRRSTPFSNGTYTITYTLTNAGGESQESPPLCDLTGQVCTLTIDITAPGN